MKSKNRSRAGFARRTLMGLGLSGPRKAVVVSDCADQNAVMRVSNRLEAPVSFVGSKNTLEAGGNLMDALDSLRGIPSVVLANVAPRNENRGGLHVNGSPFAGFWLDQTLVVTTIGGSILSFLKALDLIEYVMCFDMEHVLSVQCGRKMLSGNEKFRIQNSQFRSFEFAPLLAHLLWHGFSLPHEKIWAEDILDLPKGLIWMIDEFGNAKLTTENTDDPEEIQTKEGALPYHKRLADVPAGKASIVSGSSGYDKRRFLELVVNGGSAESRFKLEQGDSLLHPARTEKAS